MTSSGAPLWYLVVSLVGVCALVVGGCVYALRHLGDGWTAAPELGAAPQRWIDPLTFVPLFIERDEHSEVLDGLVLAPTGNGIPVTLRLRLPDDVGGAQIVESALLHWVATEQDVVLDVRAASSPRRNVTLSHGDTLVRLVVERFVAGTGAM
jgi:hypothetical protein